MKKLLLATVTLFLIISISCKNARDCVDEEQEISQIENVLDQYILANENQDFSIIEKIWSTKDDIVLIGTDSDEKLIGWNSIKKAIQHQFKSFDEVYITDKERIINLGNDGKTAWFSVELSYNFIYKGEAKSFEGIRFTGVLIKANENWELVQGHLSIPAEVDIEKE